MQENLPDESPSPDRWTLVRDAAVLQVKLIVDGLRDFLLVPASIIAAIASLVSSENGKPGPQFYRLVSFGKRTERWIDLFAASRNSPEGAAETGVENEPNIDALVSRMESFVVDEYRRGGVTKQAKDQIDKALNAMQRQFRQGRDESGKRETPED